MMMCFLFFIQTTCQLICIHLIFVLMTDDGHDRPKPREGRPPLPPPDEYKCLIRAKSSSKKLSTVVSQDDVPKLMEEYSKILKNGMDNLKKVKRNRNKTKAAQGL